MSRPPGYAHRCAAALDALERVADLVHQWDTMHGSPRVLGRAIVVDALKEALGPFAAGALTTRTATVAPGEAVRQAALATADRFWPDDQLGNRIGDAFRDFAAHLAQLLGEK